MFMINLLLDLAKLAQCTVMLRETRSHQRHINTLLLLQLLLGHTIED